MAQPTTITAYPDGPLVVRGPVDLVDERGRPVETRRRVVALCVCDRSSIAPFCDGSHKAGRRPGAGQRARAAAGTTGTTDDIRQQGDGGGAVT